MKQENEENFDVRKKAKGEYQDEIWELQPDGSEKLIEQTPWESNMVLIGLSTLISMLLLGEGGISGLQFHGIGHGDASWDITVPDPGYTDTTLYDEYYRKQPDSIQYVDDMGAPVVGPTNCILITTTFDFGEGTGSVREQGLFGGDATVALDSGYMINAIRHKEIYKGATQKLIRRIRYTFGS